MVPGELPEVFSFAKKNIFEEISYSFSWSRGFWFFGHLTKELNELGSLILFFTK